MKKKTHSIYFVVRRTIKVHNKRQNENKRRTSRNLGWAKFCADVKRNALEKGKSHSAPLRTRSSLNLSQSSKPQHSAIIEYLASKKIAFSVEGRPKSEDGYFIIPRIFSLTECYEESYSFLNRLFYCLYFQSNKSIVIDYKNCERIDLDASLCMDIILAEFIKYIKLCRIKKHLPKLESIKPINYEKDHIKKILFSIGAFKSIKNVSINYPDIIPYPLTTADSSAYDAPARRELDITHMVDYVLECMNKMNKTLSADAEKNLFDVIGEVLINAEEHSTEKKRYSIGYFQDAHENGEHIGVFNLVILNFGHTIYEKFKDKDCPNEPIVSEMKALSESFTKRNLFLKAEFEEETLWTLYSLQQGVTSKADWKRGHGSIAFIESFFNLKGSQDVDNKSHLSIFSGNTRITFDGTYRIKEVQKSGAVKPFRMMTFNELGDIEDKPDKKFVIFAENYFPGTIISAKICIKEDNLEKNG